MKPEISTKAKWMLLLGAWACALFFCWLFLFIASAHPEWPGIIAFIAGLFTPSTIKIILMFPLGLAYWLNAVLHAGNNGIGTIIVIVLSYIHYLLLSVAIIRVKKRDMAFAFLFLLVATFCVNIAGCVQMLNGH